MYNILNDFLIVLITNYLYLYINIIKPKEDKLLIKHEKDKIERDMEINHEQLKAFLKHYTSNGFHNLGNEFNETINIFYDSKYLEYKSYVLETCPIRQLKPIVSTFYDYLPGFSFLFLPEKLKTLKLEKVKEDNPVLYKILGCYNPLENKISLNSISKGTLAHEFIHAISTKIEDNLIFTGFAVKTNGINLFSGLNEGFTELITERIFAFKEKTYKTNVNACACLELLFNSPQELETAYFLNNFNYLFNGFLKYGSLEEFIYFNYLLDLSEHFDDYEDKLNDLILEIITRTNNEDKINKANEILKKKEPHKVLQLITRFKN